MKNYMKKPAMVLAGLVMLATPLALHAALPMPADMTSVYQVKGLTPGNVLKMYKEPGGKGVIVNLPHNARWIVRRNDQQVVGKTTWEKISWGDDQTGWVKSDALVLDPEATAIARARRACMADPKVKDKECCGYPNSGKGKFHSVPIYQVKGLSAGHSLMMYSEHNGDAIAVEIPHNATWIAKLGQRAEGGKVNFELVRWSGQNGWVDDAFLSYDEKSTKEGDRKRQKCGGVSVGVEFKKSEVVCLPAPVIRRLQEAGALDAATIDKLKSQAK